MIALALGPCPNTCQLIEFSFSIDLQPGILNQNEDRKIYGLLTTTKLKILLMVSASTPVVLR